MDQHQMRAELGALHPLNFGWALSCCGGDPDQAEDVLQSAYLKVFGGRARFEQKAPLKTWFFGVIRNTAREERRRRAIARLGLLRYEPVNSAPAVPDRAARISEDHRELRAALQQLSARQREVLHLIFYQDLTIKAAAAVMEVSLGSARKHYDRGKRRLRQLLSNADS